MHRTGLNRWQNPGTARAAAGINPLVSQGVLWGSAVIGSGVHVSMVCSDYVT